MKLIIFVQLLQGILTKVIDEVEAKAGEMSEEELDDDVEQLDLQAFDFILGILTDMKGRYVTFKNEYENDNPDFEERMRTLKLVVNNDDDDDSGNDGGLH